MQELIGTADEIKIDCLLNYNHELLLDLFKVNAENRIMKSRVKAWENGWKAYRSGVCLFNNPYAENEVFEFAFWSSAWLYAQKAAELNTGRLINNALLS